MATIGTLLHTWFCGQQVGSDRFGNRYYQEKREPSQGRRRRWVLYKGIPEASKVPPEWHAWLHYTTDAPLPAEGGQKWEKPHVPNLTGTAYAYLPPGHTLKGGKRPRTGGDYEPWKP